MNTSGGPNTPRYTPSSLPIQQSPGMMSMLFITAFLLICPVLFLFLAFSAGNFSMTCQRFDQHAGECRIEEYKGLFGRIAPTITILPLEDIQSIDLKSRPGNPGLVYELTLHTRNSDVSVGTESDLNVIQERADRINAFLQDSSADRLKITPSIDDYGGYVPVFCGGGVFLLCGSLILWKSIFTLTQYFLLSPRRRRSIAEIPADEMPSSLVFPARTAGQTRPELSLYEILRRDVQTYYFCLIMIIPWSGAVLIGFKIPSPTWNTDPETHAAFVKFLVWLAILLTLIFMPLLLRRLLLIKRILDEGADVTGLLVRIPNSNSPKLTIAYSYEGRNFETTQGLRFDLKSPIGAYQVGDKVDLLVDKDDPRRVLLWDLWQ